jgi:hypothetical protein
LFGKLTHAKETIGDEHVNIRHRMDGTPEVASMMNERVRYATAREDMTASAR